MGRLDNDLFIYTQLIVSYACKVEDVVNVSRTYKGKGN